MGVAAVSGVAVTTGAGVAVGRLNGVTPAANAPRPMLAVSATAVPPAASLYSGSRGNRAQQAAKKQLTICETAIARLEADSARLEAEMAENACDAEKLNALYQEQQDVQKRLEQEMERWEELSLQAEEQEER